MGVRYLLQYVRSTISRTYRLSANEGEKPTLILDLLSSCRRYLPNNYFWDFTKLRQQIRRDVEAFHKAGFQLIVFTDGGLDQRRFENWFIRRQKDLDRLKKLNSLLLSENPERVQITTGDWRPPLSAAHYLCQAFREAQCPVYIAEDSADHEGAGLCIKHEAFGMLSCDTDFLVFPGIQRFLYFNSLRVEENGEILVDGVEKSLFLRYLGISEEKLPMLVGFLGNDLYHGVSLRDKKYLQYKWKLEMFPEAAAMEVMNVPTALLPEASRLALEYYKPVIPTNESSLQEQDLFSPEWRHLEKTKWKMWVVMKRFARGIAIDSLAKKPCHEVLFPLRKAVYARNHFPEVTEFICHPHTNPETWNRGNRVIINEEIFQAPEPPSEVEACIKLCCSYLSSVDELNEFYFKALLLQSQQREKLLSEKIVFPIVPKIEDLHVAGLFLQTVEIMYLGSKTPHPPCWELFHGPLFHYLCQQQSIVETSDLTLPQVFDWSLIIQPSIPSIRAQES